MTKILNKTALFIDGSNLYAASRLLDMPIDYKKLRNFIEKQYSLLRAYYYTAITEEEDGHSPLQPLADWLCYNGYTVVTKSAKSYTNNGYTKVKGNMDIEIAIDIMEISDHVDHIILVSGNGDFRKLVESVQRKGVKVTVISTLQSSPPLVSDELRRQADSFVDLENIRDHIEKLEGARS